MKRIILAALVGVLVAALSAPAARADLDEAWFSYGWLAYVAGDYAAAIEKLRPLAERGHAQAQSYLGIMYNEGQGVPQDYAQALKWFRKSAQPGLAEAQYNLGNMYYNRDSTRQLKFTRDDDRRTYCRYDTLRRLRQTEVVPQDYKIAVKWFTRATEQEDAAAQSNLGPTQIH